MTLSYLSVPLIGLVDTGVIGQLGDAALIGGIAVGAILFDVVYTALNFLRSGTTGLTAQAYGAGDAKEQAAVLARAVLLALGFGAAIIALQVPFYGLGAALMGVDGDVADATRTYFLVRVWAAPFALLNAAVLGWLMGVARATAVLVLTTALALSNIGFSLLFVLGFRWGVAGVAWASVLAEALSLVAALPFAWRALDPSVRPSRIRIFDRRGYARMIAVNRDIMVRSFALLFSFAYFTRQGTLLGDVTLAANGILMQFFLVGGYFLDGTATAAEQLAGRAVGARWRPAFDRAVRLTLLWGAMLAGALSAVFFLGGGALIRLLTTSEDVRAAAYAYLPWAALTPLAGVVAFQFDGVFIGATWSRDMRNMMLLSLALFVACVWALVPAFGNHGLWASLLIFLISRGIALGLRLSPNRAVSFP